MWNGLRALLVGASLCVMVSGCSTTLRTTDLDANGRFPTSTKLKTGAVKEVRPFDSKYKPLLYVKTDEKLKEYNDFFANSFAKIGVFDRVLQKKDLEALVFERKLNDRVSSISDLIGLSQLEKLIGPFLIVEPYVEFKGGYNFAANLKVFDPATGATVLLIENEAFNWAGLDKPLFFPLFNGFIEWTANKQITMAAPVNKKPGEGSTSTKGSASAR